MRSKAVEILEHIGDARPVEAFMKMLGKHENSSIRLKAAEVLGKISDIRVKEHLIKALEDENPYVRIEAAKALTEIGVPAIEPLLKDRSSYVRKEVAFALDQMDWKPENEREKVYYLIAKRK